MVTDHSTKGTEKGKGRLGQNPDPFLQTDTTPEDARR